MSGLTEKEQRKMQTGILLRAEAGVLLALLQEKKEAAIEALCGSFRLGDKERVFAIVAEINVYESLISDIERKEDQTKYLERKDYEHRTGIHSER